MTDDPNKPPALPDDKKEAMFAGVMNRIGCYYLDGKTPVKATFKNDADFTAWSEFRCDDSRTRVAEDQIGPVWISTVFLGIDHNHGMGEKPILFETMAFDVPGYGTDNPCVRACTWEEAEYCHKEMCERIRGLLEAKNRK